MLSFNHPGQGSLHMHPSTEVHFPTTDVPSLFSSTRLWSREGRLQDLSQIEVLSMEKACLRNKKKKQRQLKNICHQHLPTMKLLCLCSRGSGPVQIFPTAHSDSRSPPTATESKVWISISSQHYSMRHPAWPVYGGSSICMATAKWVRCLSELVCLVRELKTFEKQLWRIGIDDLMLEIAGLREGRCSKTAVGHKYLCGCARLWKVN